MAPLPPRSWRFISVLTLVSACASSLLGQTPSGDAISESEIARQFQLRHTYLIDQELARIDTHDLTKGGPIEIATCFYRHTNLAWANARLAKIDADKPVGDMFWMFPMVAVMETGAGLITAPNQARIHELWRTAFPYRGDTENHWLLYYSSLYLAAELDDGAGPAAWYNGKSSAENMAEARSYIEDWIGITTTKGQGEFNSPDYIAEYMVPLSLLAGWTKDPVLRREARMMLDYMFYDYAVEQLTGEYGGAHSRIYPTAIVQPGRTNAAAFGWLMFGLDAYRINGYALILGMSGYTPPSILYRIANDRSEPYVDLERKRTRWRIRHAGPDAIEVEGKSTVPVYKYTYMDPDFEIGSCQGGILQPIQQETWSLVWRDSPTFSHESTFFGLQPYSSPYEGTMYFPGQWDTVTNLITRSKADYDSTDKLIGGSPYEQLFQHGPALIALYDLPANARFPHITTFFSRDLARRESDKSGWIFCQGGPAYFAYYPFAAGQWKPMGWTGFMKGGAGGWFSAGYADYARNNQCLVSDSLRNGYIVQAAPARDYRSFADFKTAVRALPIQFSLDPVPQASFTSLDSTTLRMRYGDVPSANRVAVDYSRWPLFDGPYGQASPESGRLEMRYGPERYLLDFKKLTIQDSFVPTTP